MRNVLYTSVTPPTMPPLTPPPDLPGEVYERRLNMLLTRMKEEQLDSVVVYADREHGSNFGYLTGFEPRFEESCLVVNSAGKVFCMLGNENLKMAAYSRIPMTGLHTPALSLPNQPLKNDRPLEETFGEAGISAGNRVGLIGWKLLRGCCKGMFDVPEMIVTSLKKQVGESGAVINATGLMIHPKTGIRLCVGADEIAHYEYAAAQASQCVFNVLEAIRPGVTEQELAALLNAHGMPLSCYSMCSGDNRFQNAVVYPRNRSIELGSPLTTSMGLRGGLTCRAGYVAASESELPEGVRDYVSKMVKPYFKAAVTWLESIQLHANCGEIYQKIEDVLPSAEYGWTLNPGHYTADEEWVSSPFFSDSDISIRSGMLMQMDIICKVPGYGGVNAEDGIAVCDQTLREELAQKYPDTLSRMMRRKEYMRRELGIHLHDEVLPMSDLTGYLRPLLLERGMAMKVNR